MGTEQEDTFVPLWQPEPDAPVQRRRERGDR
jgi:hypothetical protein